MQATPDLGGSQLQRHSGWERESNLYFFKLIFAIPHSPFVQLRPVEDRDRSSRCTGQTARATRRSIGRYTPGQSKASANSPPATNNRSAPIGMPEIGHRLGSQTNSTPASTASPSPPKNSEQTQPTFRRRSRPGRKYPSVGVMCDLLPVQPMVSTTPWPLYLPVSACTRKNHSPPASPAGTRPRSGEANRTQ